VANLSRRSIRRLLRLKKSSLAARNEVMGTKAIFLALSVGSQVTIFAQVTELLDTTSNGE
jgi:hypothetical protein